MGIFVINTDAIRAREEARLRAGLAAADDPAAYMKAEREASARRLEKAQAELAEARARRVAYDKCCQRCWALKEEASLLEASGDLVGACEKYEAAVADGVASGINPMDYASAWDRLMVLYRKLRRYRDEERVLLATIAAHASKGAPCLERRIKKYEERLAKCRVLLAKTQNSDFR